MTKKKNNITNLFNKNLKTVALIGLLILIAIFIAVFYKNKKDDTTNNTSQQQTYVTKIKYQEENIFGNSTIPKGVKTTVNEDGKAEITISAGKFTSGLSRQLAIAKNGVSIEEVNNKKILKIKADLYRGDTAISLPQNPRTKVILKDKLPAGNYQIDVLLSDRSGGPGSSSLYGQETLAGELLIN